MAFQSNVFRNGAWVTETVNVRDALRASALGQKPILGPQDEQPKYGILSRTVIDSPLARWILPVRLRSRRRNDVAFIGTRHVQISELDNDAQMHEVIKKDDFDSRIRNAIVVGDYPFDPRKNVEEKEKQEEDNPFLETEEDAVMLDASEVQALAPQMLVLFLESGDSIFLFLRTRWDGGLEFVTKSYKSPRNLAFLGYHLAVDPTSRYMAAASGEAAFIVYELFDFPELNEQYISNGSFEPVKSMRIRAIKGAVHSMEFLFPRPEDTSHIILVLIISRRDPRTRRALSYLVIYDWEVGSELNIVLAEEKAGLQLAHKYRAPLMIIPLRLKNCFYAVFDRSIVIVKEPLSGSPLFDSLDAEFPVVKELHYGSSRPLWSSWTRPFRLRKWSLKTDIIYVAREDGIILHLEVDTGQLVPSANIIGCLTCNVSTAFTAAYDVFSDLVIVGGDSCPGGLWKLSARKEIEQVGSLPDWSPVVDLATTYQQPVRQGPPVSKEQLRRLDRAVDSMQKPDRIFTASGRGQKGSLTELRWGIQARIGLEIDLDENVRQSWMFRAQENDEPDFYTLLSLPHSSTALHISSNLSQAVALDAGSVEFDVSSRTLCATKNEHGLIIQVTESSTSIITPSQSSRHLHEVLCSSSGLLAEDAACLGDIVVLSTHHQQHLLPQLHVLRTDQMAIFPVTYWDTEGSTTCIELSRVSGDVFIVVGSMVRGMPCITIYSLQGRVIARESIGTVADINATDGRPYVDAFTSVCVLVGDADDFGLVLGSRNGHLVTCQISLRSPETTPYTVEKLGTTPVKVFSAAEPFNGKLAVFVCCDNNLIIMTDFCPETAKLKTRDLILPTDSNDLTMPSPSVHSVFCLERSLSVHQGHMSLVLLAGSRLFLADIWPHMGPISRIIPLNGQPSRVIFSQTWKCLIAGVSVGGYSSLAFIDPETGGNIGIATDKENQRELEFIGGLGQPNDRIFGLHEWLYVKDSKTFAFIIVTTAGGRLLVVSAIESNSKGDHGSVRRIKYWTRYKKALPAPVYSVVGDASGLMYCVENILHWDWLDLEEKKLKPKKQYPLDSPAISLQIVDGKIHALTTSHSLQVIDRHSEAANADMALVHSDRVTRYTNHQIDIGDAVNGGVKRPVTLLGTSHGGVVGIRMPQDQLRKEFEVLFEATLPESIRKFSRGHIRPLWHESGQRPRYNCLPSTHDGAEILGVSLDGTLHHFALLGADLWRFLRLLQNLAQRSKEICPFMSHGTTYGEDDDGVVQLNPRPSPATMHIKGEILQRCLNMRALESLVGTGDGLVVFCEYLDKIEDGAYTNMFRNHCDDETQLRKRYFELAYQILEYLMTPVL